MEGAYHLTQMHRFMAQNCEKLSLIVDSLNSGARSEIKQRSKLPRIACRDG